MEKKEETIKERGGTRILEQKTWTRKIIFRLNVTSRLFCSENETYSFL
jgi:hypothetical protein